MKQDTWATLCHLGGLTGYFANGLGSIIVPLIVWLIKKDEMPAVDRHGREAINFNISISLYLIACGVFSVLTFGLGMMISVPLVVGLVIFHFVCVIRAAISASNGEDYHYPLSLPLLR